MIVPNSYSFETALKGNPKYLYAIPKGSTIEFPCFEHEKLSDLFRICEEQGLYCSLHYPSYYSYNRVGFNYGDDYNLILEDIKNYYFTYKNIKYMLCHFPYHSFTATYIEEDILYKYISAMSDMVVTDTPLLIENTSIVSNCSSAADYAHFLANTKLSFCLDIGHAHLLNKEEPFAFCQLLSDKIKAIHYYNTPNKQHDKIGYHYPYDDPETIDDDRFIDLKALSSHIRNLNNLSWIVDESMDAVSSLSNTL